MLPNFSTLKISKISNFWHYEITSAYNMYVIKETRKCNIIRRRKNGKINGFVISYKCIINTSRWKSIDRMICLQVIIKKDSDQWIPIKVYQMTT